MADGASASQVMGAQAGYARGDAKRRSPIGARAYGIPRKARAVALAPTVRTSPRIAPCVVVTTSYVCAAAAAASAATTTDPTDAIHTIISPAAPNLGDSAKQRHTWDRGHINVDAKMPLPSAPDDWRCEGCARSTHPHARAQTQVHTE
jgi:hypothetical protein